MYVNVHYFLLKTWQEKQKSEMYKAIQLFVLNSTKIGFYCCTDVLNVQTFEW